MSEARKPMTWSACLALIAGASLLSGYGGRTLALARRESERAEKLAARPSAISVDRTDRVPTGAAAGRKGLSELLFVPDPLQRVRLVLAWTQRASVEELAEGYLEARKRVDEGNFSQELELVLRAWADRDFSNCFEWAQKDGTEYERVTVAAQWAAKDPGAALAWAREQWSGTDSRQNAWLAGVMSAIAKADPERARLELAKLPQESQASLLNGCIMSEVVTRGFDYTEDWLRGISDDALRQRAIFSSVALLSRFNPQDCAELAGTLTEVKIRQNAFGTVASRWAQSDFAAAKSWVEGLPEETRAKAIGQIVRTWVKDDPQAAGAWLLPMAGDPQLAAARKSYLDRLSPVTDREAMLDFVSTVPFEGERAQYWKTIFQPWARQDRAAAQQWIDQHPDLIPADLLEKFKR